MEIVETNIRFEKVLSARKSTKRIVVHHSASSIKTTWQDIQRWHNEQGWNGIGYHYVIHANGTIYRGRPEYAKGAHAYQDDRHEANSDGIGICLIGNFQIGVPTDAQLDSLIWLIGDIWSRYSEIPVIGHNEVMATSCPGINFPWEELSRTKIKEKLEEMMKMVYKTLNDIPDWGKPVIKKLLARKTLQGDGNGNINISEDVLRVLVILDREGVLK